MLTVLSVLAALAPGAEMLHSVLPVKATGRVVIAPDGKSIAFLDGGKVRSFRIGAAKAEALADATEGAHFLSGEHGKAGLVCDTADGVRLLVGGSSTLLVKGGRFLALDPTGEHVAAKTAKGIMLVPVKPGTAQTFNGVAFAGFSTDGKKALLISEEKFDVEAVDLETGKRSGVVTEAALKKLCGVEIGEVEVGGAAEGKVLLSVRQKAHEAGPYDVPAGAKERGKSPGSAEPVGGPPAWSVLVKGGKAKVISVNWTARYCDRIEVLPSAKLDRFLFAQMAHRGVALDPAEPECWLGMIDAKGVKKEKKLAKTPFPAGMRGVRWTVLDLKPDAGRALVLVTCGLEVLEPMKDEGDLADLTVKRGRAGQPRGKNAVFQYQAWSLWSFDVEKGTMRQVSKLYSEKVPELAKAAVGLEGKLGTLAAFALEDHVAYSRTSGKVALSLNDETVFTEMGAKTACPVVVLKVPEW